MGPPNYYNLAFDVVFDHSGDIYTTGHFMGTMDLNPGLDSAFFTSKGIEGDAFILKLSSSGAYEWARTYGGLSFSHVNSGRALAVDLDNNVYLSGHIADTVDFDTLSNNGELDTESFLLKLDSTGNYVWVVKNPTAHDLTVDSQGNILLAGEFGMYGSIWNTDLDPQPCRGI